MEFPLIQHKAFRDMNHAKIHGHPRPLRNSISQFYFLANKGSANLHTFYITQIFAQQDSKNVLCKAIYNYWNNLIRSLKKEDHFPHLIFI